MIQIYDETWKYLIRLHGFTSRRRDFMPFCTIDTAVKYIESCKSQILDIGCGENNFKLHYPNKIVGMDKTHEADIFAFMGDDAWNDLPMFEYGMAMNSLQQNDLDGNIRRALTKCKKLYLTLNDNSDISNWKDASYWNRYGIVEYFWHGQNVESENALHQFLENDPFYRNTRLSKLEEDVRLIANEGIYRDARNGVLRVIIKTQG